MSRLRLGRLRFGRARDALTNMPLGPVTPGQLMALFGTGLGPALSGSLFRESMSSQTQLVVQVGYDAFILQSRKDSCDLSATETEPTQPDDDEQTARSDEFGNVISIYIRAGPASRSTANVH